MSASSKRSSLAATKARYIKAQDAARRQALKNLAPVIGEDYYLTEYSNRSQIAVEQQWDVDTHPYPNQRFDWDAITRTYRQFKCMTIAAWIPAEPERLAALGITAVGDRHVTLECIEADPRPDCPLKGLRALIMIETAVCYAQALGKIEIRLVPANEHLRELYEQTYGFTLETPKQGKPYWVRKV